MTGDTEIRLTALVADVWQRARQHASMLTMGSLISALVLALALELPFLWAVIAGSLAAIGCVQILVARQFAAHRYEAGSWRGWRPNLRLLASAVLLLLVLGFLLLLTLLTTTMVVIGVMVGSGFDFDQASQAAGGFEQAMATYRETPGWLICQGVFLFGLAVWFYAVARALPFVPGVIIRRRVIALEAFSWTTGHGVKILGALILVFSIPAIMALALSVYAPHAGWAGIIVLAFGLFPTIYLAGAFCGSLGVFVPEDDAV